jgi:hypothetical protein
MVLKVQAHVHFGKAVAKEARMTNGDFVWDWHCGRRIVVKR